MPEGPSIVILREAVASFTGKIIREVNGNTKQDVSVLKGKRISAFLTWGKHFLICAGAYKLRIHFLLFGSYLVNDTKPATPRLQLRFAKGEINFYACSVQFIDEDLDDVYDWTADIMNPRWDARKAGQKLRAKPEMLVCDAILDQDIFAGAGNIFKNEVLYRIKVHPLSTVGSLTPAKLRELIRETHHYAFQFLEWKKAYVLRKNWLAHTKKTCKRCNLPLHKEYLGKTKRRTFFCTNCQKLYDKS